MKRERVTEEGRKIAWKNRKNNLRWKTATANITSGEIKKNAGTEHIRMGNTREFKNEGEGKREKKGKTLIDQVSMHNAESEF